MTSMSVPEVKRLSNGCDYVGALWLAGLKPQLGNRTVRNLIYDAACERFERLFLLRGERSHAALDFVQLADANQLELFLKPDDGRRDLGHFETRHHALHFLEHHL